jgi:hypothetical protein
MLVFGLILAGCSTDGGQEDENQMTQFEGTWKTGFYGGINDSQGTIQATYKFTNNNWIFSSNDESEQYFAKGPLSGNFEFTETTITFVISDDSSVTWVMDYALQNGSMTITNSQGNNPTKLSNAILTR